MRLKEDEIQKAVTTGFVITPRKKWRFVRPRICKRRFRSNNTCFVSTNHSTDEDEFERQMKKTSRTFEMASTPVDAPEVGTRPAPKHNKNSPQKEHIYIAFWWISNCWITGVQSLRKTCLLGVNIGCSHHVQNIMFSYFIHQLQLLC